LGIDIGDGKSLSILLYADDIVLLAKSEGDLQLMLNILSDWCSNNHMNVNLAKSNIMHFRTPSKQRSQHMFNDNVIQYTDRNTYFGIVLTEHLDYNVTAKFVSQAAGRAFGLLIAKFRSIGGMSYHAYSKLYDS